MTDDAQKTLGQVLAECLLDDCKYATIRQEPHKAHIVEGSFNLEAIAEAFLKAVGNRAPYAAQDDDEMITAALAFERETQAWGVLCHRGRDGFEILRKTSVVENGFEDRERAVERMVFLRRVMALTAALDVLRSNASRTPAAGLDESDADPLSCDQCSSVKDVTNYGGTALCPSCAKDFGL